MNNLDILKNKLKGCFFGCSVGDALGASNEFSRIREHPNSPRYTDMQYVSHFKLPAGSWTDDTSMMLCIAEALIEYGLYDHRTTMKYYSKWFYEGHNSSSGKAFDIGSTCTQAIVEYKLRGYLPARTNNDYQQSNGCIMRLAPIAMFHSNDIDEAVRVSGESALTTHAHPVCFRTTQLFGWLLTAALNSYSKHNLLHFIGAPIEIIDIESVPGKPILTALDDLLSGNYLEKTWEQVMNSGYVVGSLETALWAFAKTNSFEEGLILTVNLGGDADTIGAIYGMLAGAYYGFDSIPSRWLEPLQKYSLLESIYNKFLPYCLSNYDTYINDDNSEAFNPHN
jgi:ADP-ribosyl-[dinitrogen reductase] hydrolase